MHDFHYRHNEFYCEDVRISEIARKVGTPVFIYSRRTLLDHYRKIKDAFRSINPLICFSIKANSNLALLKALAGKGAGMDVVSGGELFRALKVGVSPNKIVYAGVGKGEAEITAAVKAGIFLFNVESLAELAMIEQVAGRLKKKVNVSLRVNPDVDPHTHKFITTGKMTNKFGLDMQTAEEIFLRAQPAKYSLFEDTGSFSHINLVGIHIHIGSQITQSRPFVSAIKKALVLINRLKQQGVVLKYFNIGGGLGIIYRDEKAQSAQDFARAVLPLLKKTGLKVILEPGRFIAGNSGILVTRIVYIKETPGKNFAIVDAGMNDLIRPSLYEAYHEILPVVRAADHKLQTTKYDIVGPICESADFMGKDRSMQALYAQDLLAVMSAGAYGFVMSSNYNSRPRVAEVLVNKSKYALVRKRETYQDLIRHEVISR
jgi:diaminopimelate decarboxylase